MKTDPATKTRADAAAARVTAFLPLLVDVPGEPLTAQLGTAMFADDVRTIIADRARLLSQQAELKPASTHGHHHDHASRHHRTEIAKTDIEPASAAPPTVPFAIGAAAEPGVADAAREVLAWAEAMAECTVNGWDFTSVAPGRTADKEPWRPLRLRSLRVLANHVLAAAAAVEGAPAPFVPRTNAAGELIGRSGLTLTEWRQRRFAELLDGSRDVLHERHALEREFFTDEEGFLYPRQIINTVTGALVELDGSVRVHIDELDRWIDENQERFLAEWNAGVGRGDVPQCGESS